MYWGKIVPAAWLSVHSQTFPTRSYAPENCERPLKNVPTLVGRPSPSSAVFAAVSTKVSLQGYSNPADPRAAHSHSGDVGRRLPRHAAKARASNSVTRVAGRDAGG